MAKLNKGSKFNSFFFILLSGVCFCIKCWEIDSLVLYLYCFTCAVVQRLLHYRSYKIWQSIVNILSCSFRVAISILLIYLKKARSKSGKGLLMLNCPWVPLEANSINQNEQIFTRNHCIKKSHDENT